MIEPNCDMPWDIYLDWLQDQGNEDLRFIDIASMVSVGFCPGYSDHTGQGLGSGMEKVINLNVFHSFGYGGQFLNGNEIVFRSFGSDSIFGDGRAESMNEFSVAELAELYYDAYEIWIVLGDGGV